MLKATLTANLAGRFNQNFKNRNNHPMNSHSDTTAAAMAATPHLTLKEIADSYDALLLDQFGVLHDGVRPYSTSIAAVEYLAERGTQMLIISNSSRRAGGALNNLAKMGFPIDAFTGVITSGEVTHRQLTTRSTPFWQSRHSCIHITWADRGAISLEGTNLTVTTVPEEADFVLAHGTEAIGTQIDGVDAERKRLDELKSVLKQCADRGLPLVVANPDVVTVHGSELRTMPGTLARWYKEFGGEVHLMGKPAPIIYKAALEMLPNTRPKAFAKVLAVGDSLEHDIAGAASAGIDSVLIAGGIHAGELLPCGGQAGQGGLVVCQEGLRKLNQEYQTAAKFVMPFFEPIA